jgi:tetratricopeptide (TPR) repeat protein
MRKRLYLILSGAKRSRRTHRGSELPGGRDSGRSFDVARGKPELENDLRAADAALAAAPLTIEPRLRRAGLLAALGRVEAAKDDYLAVLAAAPDHLEALNDLGTLLHGAGFLSAARTCYETAVARHPEAPRPRVNLGNLLIEAGTFDEAEAHYDAALKAAPDLPEAHQGLARVLAERGEDEAASRHRAAGFRERFLIERPWRGEGDGVPLLVLIAAAGGNVETRFLIDDAQFRTTLLVADFFPAGQPLPPHALIFNAIGDADLARDALAAAAALAARSAAPIVNPPRAVKATGRVENARRLGGIPGLRVPRTELFARAVLTPDALAPFGFPLLLRRPGFHTGRHFVMLEDASGLAASLDRLPGAELLAIQYLDARGPDGFARKYRAMIVDGALYPLHLAVSSDWKVHYFTAAMAESAAHRAEEARFLADLSTIGETALRALEQVRDVLGLDYGGVDFGLDATGNLLLFEANATMVVNPPEPDPRWDYRRPAVTRILDAVRAMLRRRAVT